jgi:hypothetical protein
VRLSLPGHAGASLPTGPPARAAWPLHWPRTNEFISAIVNETPQRESPRGRVEKVKGPLSLRARLRFQNWSVSAASTTPVRAYNAYPKDLDVGCTSPRQTQSLSAGMPPRQQIEKLSYR